MELIDKAAILIDGVIYSTERPGRHYTIIKQLIEEKNFKSPIKGIQGFVTNNGRFLNRKEALELAVKNNQVELKNCINKFNLFSEDLW